jgi:hypothetical protein
LTRVQAYDLAPATRKHTSAKGIFESAGTAGVKRGGGVTTSPTRKSQRCLLSSRSLHACATQVRPEGQGGQVASPALQPVSPVA